MWKSVHCKLFALVGDVIQSNQLGLQELIVVAQVIGFVLLPFSSCFQEISNCRTHGLRTPKKPEYLVARSQLTNRGPLGFGPIQYLMNCC